MISGIDAYLMNTAGGFITSIKTLYSEIEGIVRINYLKEIGANPSFSQLINYVEGKASVKFGSYNSLGFPGIFYEYLKEVVFRSFDLKQGIVNLSRHSTSHGVAKSTDYTKAKAFEAILVLDQIYFYFNLK